MRQESGTSDDVRLMGEALALARRGAGAVEPNPMVGCVVARQGRVVGRGYHRRFGGPHAEANALAQAGRAARGASCYVTLEPCCHYGKTAPCTEALIAAGVGEVVVACADPFEPVAGGGLRGLRRAGVAVRLGVLEEQAQRLNAGYFKLRAVGRPLVILKWAQSLDGKIAARTKNPEWISNEASRREAHRLRRRCQAVLVGIETVLRDDPLLTARVGRGRQPLRIVLDSHLRMPLDSQLVVTAAELPVLVATTRVGVDERRKRADRLADRGVEVLALRAARGRVSLAALLNELGRRQIAYLLVEGGGEVLGSFVDRRLADRVVVFVSPMLIGGARSVAAVGGEGMARVAQAMRLRHRRVRHLGEDLMIEADLGGPFASSGKFGSNRAGQP